ncbi:hypothetical protein Dsin_009256 [Dipteronia sinensis]|uniref:Uncharacterized protein n=1 Tax=Dipteronia sinensis TaxID=43782 RepID=A0AAE0EBK4_9ROSI|nr:hypothetical protein Dsin_009256 [Dipteronia sinensis]
MGEKGMMRSLSGTWLSKGVSVDANGSAGRLLSLWNEDLFDAKSFKATKRCIIMEGGDFNTVLDSSERKDGNGNMASSRNFSSFILNANVVDMPLRGITFTWSDHMGRGSWARLDRF